jgi:hypothetical protein
MHAYVRMFFFFAYFHADAGKWCDLDGGFTGADKHNLMSVAHAAAAAARYARTARTARYESQSGCDNT